MKLKQIIAVNVAFKFYLLKKNTEFDEEVIENITPSCIENYQIIQCQKLGNFDELSHIKSEV